MNTLVEESSPDEKPLQVLMYASLADMLELVLLQFTEVRLIEELEVEAETEACGIV